MWVSFRLGSYLRKEDQHWPAFYKQASKSTFNYNTLDGLWKFTDTKLHHHVDESGDGSLDGWY